MILLWGVIEDDPMGLAHAALGRAGADFFFLDHRQIFTSDIECDYDARADGPCTVTVGAATLDLTRVTAAYVRGFNFCDYEEMQERPRDDALALKAAGFETQLLAWLDASPALVLNRAEASATNGSKPCQLTAIRQAGLRIPETFIANDPAAAREFLAAPRAGSRGAGGNHPVAARNFELHRLDGGPTGILLVSSAAMACTTGE